MDFFASKPKENDSGCCPHCKASHEKSGHSFDTQKLSKKYIQVKNFNGKNPSEYKIDLKKEKIEDIWDGVELYESKREEKQKPETIDFSKIIREKQNDPHLLTKSSTPKIVETKQQEKKEKANIELKEDVQFIVCPRHRELAEPKVEKTKKGFSLALPNFKFEKPVIAVIVFLFIFALPFPAFTYYKNLKNTGEKALEESTKAFFALKSSTSAAMDADMKKAQRDLYSALNSFSYLEDITEKEYKLTFSFLEALPMFGNKIESQKQLLMAGQHLSLANSYMIKGLEEVEKRKSLNFTDKLTIVEKHFLAAKMQYDAALESFYHVDTGALPVEYQKSFEEFRVLYSAFVDDADDISQLLSTFKSAFGHEDFKRYLVVFQNNQELRATGGFMGSFAVLDVQKGKIINLEIPAGGSYDLQGQLEEDILLPGPMQLANERWEFQDANWFPDFAASAEKMAWFYRQSRGATVDGVITVNASVLERVLSVFGEIEIEGVDEKVNADNVLTFLRDEITTSEDRTKPKAVLGEVFDSVLEKSSAMDNKEMISLAGQMYSALNEKEIQVAFFDPELQETIDRFGWDGKIKQTSEGQDYLFIVNTNINGGKSDEKMHQTILHEANIYADGSIINKVTIRRRHQGEEGEAHYGVGNIDYIRVYVPEGAEMMEASGFSYPKEEWFKSPVAGAKEDDFLASKEEEILVHKKTGTRITNEFGKTVFANWVITEPGETSEVTFTYRLPFKIEKTALAMKNFEKWRDKVLGQYYKNVSQYSLVLQKQSGINSEFFSTLVYPENWEFVWSSDGSAKKQKRNNILYQKTLKEDALLGYVFKEKGEY